MVILSVVLLGIGALVGLAGRIWFVVVAFRERLLWGLGCLLVPFVALGFLVLHWRKARLPFAINLLGFLMAAAGVGLLAKTFVRIDNITGNAMYPNHPEGSKVFTLQDSFANAAALRNGDVLLYEHTTDEGRVILISRLVALPGQTVEIDGDQVLVDGKELSHQKVRTESEAEIWRETNGLANYEIAIDSKNPGPLPQTLSVKLAAGEVFLMGDNRHHVLDSRSFGPVPIGSVVAKEY